MSSDPSGFFASFEIGLQHRLRPFPPHQLLQFRLQVSSPLVLHLAYRRAVPFSLLPNRAAALLDVALVALLLALSGCKNASPSAEGLVRCAAGVRAPVELELERALPVEGGKNFQPSGLYLSSGRLLVVSDKHDDAVFELSLEGERAVARPFLEFHAPGGEALDLEGIAGGEDGSLLLASEAQFRVLAVSASGPATWLTTSLEKVGRGVGLFQKPNAGLEGVARLGKQLVIAAEREPVGLLEVADSGRGSTVAYRLPSAACPGPWGRTDDLTDLSVSDGELYALQRNGHLVVRMTRSEGHFREAEHWSYARAENAPPYRYRNRTFGLAEGLALDEQHVYVVLDNNDDPRQTGKDDRRGMLFVFKRPR